MITTGQSLPPGTLTSKTGFWNCFSHVSLDSTYWNKHKVWKWSKHLLLIEFKFAPGTQWSSGKTSALEQQRSWVWILLKVICLFIRLLSIPETKSTPLEYAALATKCGVSGVVSSRVWVWLMVMTLVPLSKALNHSCFVKGWEGSAFCSTNHAGSYSEWYQCLHPSGLWRV